MNFTLIKHQQFNPYSVTSFVLVPEDMKVTAKQMSLAHISEQIRKIYSEDEYEKERHRLLKCIPYYDENKLDEHIYKITF